MIKFTILVAKEYMKKNQGCVYIIAATKRPPPPIPNFLWLQIIFLNFRKLSSQLVNLGAPPPPQLKKKYIGKLT